MKGRFIMRRGHQETALGDSRQPEECEAIGVSEEDEHVVAPAGGVEKAQEIGRVRPLFPNPTLFQLGTRVLREHGFGQVVKQGDRARVIDTKPAHRDTVDSTHARLINIAPGHVVCRTGGEDLQVTMAAQPLSDLAAELLRTAADFHAVALNDQCDLHQAASSSIYCLNCKAIAAGAKSARRSCWRRITRVRSSSSSIRRLAI